MRDRKRFGCIAAILVATVAATGVTAQIAKAGDKKAGSATTPANETKVKATGNSPSAQANPYFQESQNQGSMPTHNRRVSAGNGSDSANTQASQGSAGATRSTTGSNERATTPAPGSGDAGVVEYKDGEEGTMHTRPATAQKRAVTPVGPPSSPSVVEYKDGEDGVTHTRPSKPK